MKKNLFWVSAAAATILLSGCANDGTYYRADTYSTAGVNQMQNVMTVEIIAITPAKIAVNNSESREAARTTGAIIGALAGLAIGNHNDHSTDSRVIGGLAGGAVGGLAGDAIGGGKSTNYVAGVQIVYRTTDGRMYQSAQVGQPCEFKTGSAILVSPHTAETRVQPNNPYGCGK